MPHPLRPCTSAPPGATAHENSITVTAGTSTASIQVNGETVATGVPYTNRVSTLHGYRFASNVTPTVDDKYLVDDVLFTN